MYGGTAAPGEFPEGMRQFRGQLQGLGRPTEGLKDGWGRSVGRFRTGSVPPSCFRQ